jgi:TPR repeat protein
MLRAIFVLSIALASSCAIGQTAAPREYNLGVDAFRAKNYEAARQHWGQASEQDRADAYNNLGYLLYNGLGGKKEVERALVLWRDAATLGQPESQWHLAQAFEDGAGMLENQAEAYAWYRCAQDAYRARAGAGSTDGDIERDIGTSITRVWTGMSESQRKLAAELAQAYVRLYAGH